MATNRPEQTAVIDDTARYTSLMAGPLAPVIARLLELVDADGRTRNEIAAAAGMSPAQLSHVLVGHRAAPSIITVERILDAIGKSWPDLAPPQPQPKRKRPKR